MNNIIRWFRSWFTPDVIFDVGKNARLPTRGSAEAAALDLYAIDSYILKPAETKVMKIGITSSFNPGWVALLWARSSMGANGIPVFGGVIDSDYRGEWGVILHNTMDDSLVINKGDRIAQIILQRCWTGTPKRAMVKVDTDRGNGALGSTGK